MAYIVQKKSYLKHYASMNYFNKKYVTVRIKNTTIHPHRGTKGGLNKRLCTQNSTLLPHHLEAYGITFFPSLILGSSTSIKNYCVPKGS